MDRRFTFDHYSRQIKTLRARGSKGSGTSRHVESQDNVTPRNETDGSTQALLKETENLLEKWKHPEPYAFPTAPGGQFTTASTGQPARRLNRRSVQLTPHKARNTKETCQHQSLTVRIPDRGTTTRGYLSTDANTTSSTPTTQVLGADPIHAVPQNLSR